MSVRRRDFVRMGVAGGMYAVARGVFLPLGRLSAEANQTAAAAGPAFDLDEALILAPDDPASWPAFRTALQDWRSATRAKLMYDDSAYNRAEFQWIQGCFSCCFLMMCDEAFHDAAENRYRVEAFLEEGRREFGGYDAVVLWHAYPRIGFDDRNQFDFYRDMPGGLSGLRQLSDRFHAAGVRVFLDYNPWDLGTRREAVSDLDALVSLVATIDADGLFLDTMHEGAEEFRGKLDAAKPGVVLETELSLALDKIDYHHMSWAQGFAQRDGAAPGVLRNKWLGRRHLQHQSDRWRLDHTRERQLAWMNGSGMLVWENVFGSWVGWSPRDRSILRAMLPIQRRYSTLFCGEGWTPLVPTLQPQVYASRWEADGTRLWTLVNRSDATVAGDLLRIQPQADTRCFDLVAGQTLEPRRDGERLVLAGRIQPRGIAAFVQARPSQLGEDFSAFLASQAATERRAETGTAAPPRWSAPVAANLPRRASVGKLSAVMAAIPAATFDMEIVMTARECGFYADGQLQPVRTAGLHKPATVLRKAVRLRPYAIDLAPVTNAQFAEFLRATGYRPAHAENFVKHWPGGVMPEALADHPVVYVDLNDARAYAAWQGQRLPREEEWQYAAQGPDRLLYPWGDAYREGCCNEGSTGTTTPVRQFPLGRSVFGCYDLCGNTWEWTESERSDGRTRFCLIRGGCYYQARGSHWYADGGPRPGNFAAKFLLLWPGLDRCATIGFRCAADMD